MVSLGMVGDRRHHHIIVHWLCHHLSCLMLLFRDWRLRSAYQSLSILGQPEVQYLRGHHHRRPQ